MRAALLEVDADIKAITSEIEAGSCVVNLGAKSDAICGRAAEKFAATSSAAGDSENEKLFDGKVTKPDFPHFSFQ